MRERTRSLILTAFFAALTAVGTLFFKIPLGATYVTLQFFFTAMAGVLLGPRYGALSQIVYVALGLMGAPVFAQGGGLGYFLVPSFGFLLGLIPAAWVVGVLAAGSGSPRRVALASLAGLAVLYLIGLPYLYLMLNGYLGKDMSLAAVVKAGMLVYLPGDAVKIAAISVLAGPLTKAAARIQA